MATGNPLPSVGANGGVNLEPSKDLGSYDPLPARFSGEGLAFTQNGCSIYGSGRDDIPNCCGSAPPSMEGSLADLDHLTGQRSGNVEARLRNLSRVAGNAKSEERLCSDPAYFKYYDSKMNLNPRLPTPRVLKESHCLMNRFSKAGEWRTLSLDDSSSGRSSPHRSTLSTHNEGPEEDRSPRLDLSSAEDARCDYRQSTSNTGSHRSNLVGLMLEKIPQGALYDNSCALSNTNSCDRGSACSGINSSKNSPLDIVNSLDLNGFQPDTNQQSHRPISSNNLIASSPPSSDHNTIMEASQQGNPIDIKPGDAVSVMLNGVDSSMEHLKISLDRQGNEHIMQQGQNDALLQNGPSHLFHDDPIQMIPQGINLSQVPFVDDFSHAHMKLHFGDNQLFPHLGVTTPFYAHSDLGSTYDQNLQLPSGLTPPCGIGGHGLHGSLLPPFVTKFAPQLPVMASFDSPLTPKVSGGSPSTGNFAAGTEFPDPFKIYEQPGVARPPSVPDLSLIHYLQQPYMHHYGGGNPCDLVSSSTNYVGNPADVFGSQKVLSETIHQSGQRFQFPTTGVSSSPATRKGVDYVGNHQSTSPYIPANSVFHGQPSSGTYPRDRRNDALGFQFSSESMARSQGLKVKEKSDRNARSFVEDVKSNKTRRVELSHIKGRIVDYSYDQNGSRFIQQKLDNCTTEEKALTFSEILPHALSMMTDLFGNYVIQKCFERGNPEQRRDLAKKNAGRVLPMSLQMYGCRVFQKALEVIELDQKIALVRELDGHVLQCVYDQNGNHVVQKCIECVPAEHTGFMVSAFQGQIARLSMHPYGCRVIQRTLEHCSIDSEGIIDEILQSACVLAKDQYGNYVMQRVLEKGKSHERSQIISKLAGQVVSMSQDKFASNVIEKCFQHGDVAERNLLIKEILKQTEANNYLLVVMKDQFANYVVKKILETCNEHQREALISRIKCHLQELKKYSYGKYISSRIEQFSGDGASTSES